MDTSTTTFCRFSPLRTPNIQKKSLKKYDSPMKDVSDTESLASVVTSEIRSIAHAVSNRLKKSSDIGMMSSDDDLFISQSKKVASPVKSARKRTVSDSNSDSSSLDTSSDSEPDTVKSPTSKNPKMLSPKKRVKLESEVISSTKKLKSPIKSSSKSKRKEKDHEISEDSEDSSFSEHNSPKGMESSVSSVLTSTTDSSKGRRGSVSSVASSSSSEERKKKCDSDSADSDKGDSDSDSSSESIEKRKKVKKKKNRAHNTSEDSDFETRMPKAKKNHDKSKSVVSKESSLGKSGSEKLWYKIPENFEIDTSPKYLTKSEVQGKQLWLITAPDDFDISVLHRQKIDLTGSSIITDEEAEDEKQYEVVARPITSQMPSFSSAASQSSGSEEFILGSEISGQLQVIGWIPCMPQVELAVSPPKKHRVPEDLKPTFVPFGSKSPNRQNGEECHSIEKVEKHKKKKKKKDKRKK
ncbi:uncharacterized protein LOC123529464 [Mercenaria mercenaria]|uniref:uncharacterized protein LOC123529464 n=1 Tax=Mercenaria mercenaria TaxID=6596 RepID=UPI00234F68B2|nr:uncharacterized protein LOC123529464 [Mercenaria mercenaria]XP_045165738.2 uncharacterized protein LOC123529464 [Mercenaria mercenaria]